jgi:hypothetical protein
MAKKRKAAKAKTTKGVPDRQAHAYDTVTEDTPLHGGKNKSWQGNLPKSKRPKKTARKAKRKVARKAKRRG